MPQHDLDGVQELQERLRAVSVGSPRASDQSEPVPISVPATVPLPVTPVHAASDPRQVAGLPVYTGVSTPLSADVQARVKAFQQARTNSQRRKKEEGETKTRPAPPPVITPSAATGARAGVAGRRPKPKLALSDLKSGGPAGLLGKPAAAPPSSNTFTHFSEYVDVKSGSLQFDGKMSVNASGIDFSSGRLFRISLDDLEFVEVIGKGNYGKVLKVVHRPTGVTMALKEVRLELDETKFQQILMELDVLHRCQLPYIVDFYGAFFVEGAVYMCIEYMDGGSLDKIYTHGVPEPELAYIAESVVRGLWELKERHSIMHRDVKPTNILVSSLGAVKLCDFGVSGNLVASMARTNIGCRSYMAPERIKLNTNDESYLVHSDIWSVGLSLLEMAMGTYPYPPETYENMFSQLSAIVDGAPPELPRDKFSAEACDFVAQCLHKVPQRRPPYDKLLRHPWLVRWREQETQEAFKQFVVKELEQAREQGEEAVKPALHRGAGLIE